MIKNRNISPYAAIDPSKIAGGGIVGAGEVFYVYNSNEASSIGAWLEDHVDKNHLFKATAAAADVGIQAALNACVTNRGDYVIIMPSEVDYDLIATLTMSKKAVHLICPSGLGNEIGSTNAARFHQNTDGEDCIAVSNSAIEIAGIYYKNYDLHAAISGVASVAGVGAYGLNIHHNTFTMRSTTTAAEPMIMFSGDAGAWGSIERNWMITAVSNATYTSIIQIEGSATSARVKSNEITIGDGCTASIGISNGAVKGLTAFNLISECGGSGVGSGGTVTVAVSIAASGNAIGNRCCVATGQGLAGGTAAHSFCDNMDGATSAGTPINLET